jgi:2-amino-4-hydroxy-6-hydroxymethyldihydropteridine diphosphokinase
MAATVYLSFGSNLGDRENNLCRACEMTRVLEGFELISCSPIYITPAVDMKGPSPDFLNMAVKGEYAFTPLELLSSLEAIERKLGRKEKGQYKPRSIDIDIILFGNEVIVSDRLTVPHKKIAERPFVLIPLLQIDPELVHPVTGEKLSSYLTEEMVNKAVLYKEYGKRDR